MSASGTCSPAQPCIWLCWDRWIHISRSWQTLWLLFQKPFQTILPLGTMFVYVASLTTNLGTAHGLLQGSLLSYKVNYRWLKSEIGAQHQQWPAFSHSLQRAGFTFGWHLQPWQCGCLCPSQLTWGRAPLQGVMLYGGALTCGTSIPAALKCLCLFLRWEF